MAELVKIFVSHHHSHDEDLFTTQLVHDLESTGVDVWVDREISSGNFITRINEGMKDRDWLVLVMTHESLQSQWVRDEVDAALGEVKVGRMKGVIPIVMEPVDELEIPLLWRPLHRYDATHDYHAALAGVLRAIGEESHATKPVQPRKVQPSIAKIAAPSRGMGMRLSWRLPVVTFSILAFVVVGTVSAIHFLKPPSGSSSKPPIVFKEYPLQHAQSTPAKIIAGFDGSLWFTEYTGNSIGHITPSGVITEIRIPTEGSHPAGVATTSSGVLWFTEFTGNKIGRLALDQTMKEYPIATANAGPDQVAIGPDGFPWFTEYTANKIGHMISSGRIREITLPIPNSDPTDIMLGPDNNLWFTQTSVNKIGRLNPDGSVTEFPLSTPNSRPNRLTLGPNGDLWFTDTPTSRLGKITMAGVITEIALPPPNAYPLGIALGGDGDIWFTERGLNSIGRITQGGVITSYPIPTQASLPVSLTLGSDGAIWFTETAGNNIGRLLPAT